MDLTSYGIDGEKVAFDKNDSASGENILTTKSVLRGFRGLEGLRLDLALHIYSEMAGSHRPYCCATFKELALKLGTNDCALRKVAKNLSKQGYVNHSKLKLDKNDAYIFTMGPRFGEKYIWKSKLYVKKLADEPRHLITPKPKNPENQTVHDGLPNEPKQSTVDSQTVHDGLPPNQQTTGNISEIPSEPAPVFSLSSQIHMSSVEPKKSFTQVSEGNAAKPDWIKGEDAYERKSKLKLQTQWLEETNGAQSFEIWRQGRG